jgi:hypothetical protein
MGGGLEMQTPEHASLGGLNLVVLDERGFDAVGRQGIRAKGFRKETAMVAVPDRLHQ